MLSRVRMMRGARKFRAFNARHMNANGWVRPAGYANRRWLLPVAMSGTGFLLYNLKKQRDLKEPVVVVGGGIMGSAVSYFLAKNGQNTTLIDAGHPVRSSWGEVRGIQFMYKNDLMYSMVTKARELWQTLAAKDQPLMVPAPAVIIGQKGSLTGALETAKRRKQPHAYICNSTEELLSKMPDCGVRFADNEECVVLDAGVILAGRAMERFEDLYEKTDGKAMRGTEVLRIDRARKMVVTDDGEVPYSRLVLCCGPWTNKILKASGLGRLPIVVSREQKVLYRQENLDHYQVGNGKSGVIAARQYIDEHGEEKLVYMHPYVEGNMEGVKVAVHHGGEYLNNEDHLYEHGTSMQKLPMHPFISNEASLPYEDASMKAVTDKFVEENLSNLDKNNAVYTMRCMYTNNANGEEFIIGPHPEDQDIIICTGFSGEGFKFAPTIGQMVANSEFPDEFAVETVKPTMGYRPSE